MNCTGRAGRTVQERARNVLQNGRFLLLMLAWCLFPQRHERVGVKAYHFFRPHGDDRHAAPTQLLEPGRAVIAFFHVPFAKRHPVLPEEGLGTLAHPTPFGCVEGHAAVCPDCLTDLNRAGKALQLELGGLGSRGRRIAVMDMALSARPFIDAGISGECMQQGKQKLVGFMPGGSSLHALNVCRVARGYALRRLAPSLASNFSLLITKRS